MTRISGIRLRQYVPKAPTRQSPVLSSLRWDSPEYCLSSSSSSSLSSTLHTNPFARLLASPPRIDRSTRLLTLPRSLLLRYSLVQHPHTSDLWYVPLVDSTRTSVASGYAVNSKRHLRGIKGKRFASIASMELLNQTYNVTTVQNVKWNDENWYVVQALYVEELIKGLETVEISQTVEEGCVVVILKDADDQQTSKIKVNGSVTYINLSALQVDHPSYQSFFTKLQDLASSDNRVILNKNNTSLIDSLLRFVSYMD